MFSVLAIDWGSKYFGIALGDPLSGLILPHTSLVSLRDVFDIISWYFERHNIQVIVLGMPEKLNGEPTKISQKVFAFAEELQASAQHPIQVVFINERESSKKSELQLNGGSPRNIKGAIHNQAASAILATYFEQL